MRIIIPGGSGQVGALLARKFHADGHHVVVLSRQPVAAPWKVTHWDGATAGPWASEIDGSDIVINLAGRNVNCRYHAENRRAILESRVLSTHAVGAAIARAKRPPRLWLQAGTATIYAHRFDAPNDEATGIVGGSELNAPDTWRFSIHVAEAWEKALNEFVTPKTRKVMLRSAMTMSPDPGGIFDTLLTLVRCGLGGQAGNGCQYISWIHEEDFVRAVQWIIADHAFSGAVNVASPHPLPNAAFMRELRKAAHIPFGFPSANWMLEIGARLLRTETELILKSRRVVPGRLLQAGFKFHFPSWPEAAEDLYRLWRAAKMPASP